MRDFTDFDDFDLGYADCPGEIYDVPTPDEMKFYNRQSFLEMDFLLHGDQNDMQIRINEPAGLIEFDVPDTVTSSMFGAFSEKLPTGQKDADGNDILGKFTHFYADLQGDWKDKELYMDVPVEGDVNTYKMMVPLGKGISDSVWYDGAWKDDSHVAVYNSDVDIIRESLQRAYDEYIVSKNVKPDFERIAMDKSLPAAPENVQKPERPLPSGSDSFDINDSLIDEDELPF